MLMQILCKFGIFEEVRTELELVGARSTVDSFRFMLGGMTLEASKVVVGNEQL